MEGEGRKLVLGRRATAFSRQCEEGNRPGFRSWREEGLAADVVGLGGGGGEQIVVGLTLPNLFCGGGVF